MLALYICAPCSERIQNKFAIVEMYHGVPFVLGPGLDLEEIALTAQQENTYLLQVQSDELPGEHCDV